MKWTNWALFVFVLLLLSYSRQVSFLSINSILLPGSSPSAELIELPFLQELSVVQLNKIKYLLTAFFFVLFAITTIAGLRFSMRASSLSKIAAVTYLAIGGIILFLGICAYLVNSFKEVYPLLRKIIGFVHSPLLFLFFSISSFLPKNENQSLKP